MKNKASRNLVYPRYVPFPVLNTLERWMVRIGRGFAFCTVCGSFSTLRVHHDNLRETCLCGRCNASNRQRQIAYVCCRAFSSVRQLRLRSLKDLAMLRDLAVYNTEAAGPVHRQLCRMKHYICSEYLDPKMESGAVRNGVMHQDLMRSSLSDGSIDLVLSSDVFEHISDPYKAHAEVYRILKKGGRHVFTVPFYQDQFLDEVRAVAGENEAPVFLKEPLYHDDPMRLKEGILVYTIFSLEMLSKMRQIGFRTNFYHLYSLYHGIVGYNALLFEAIKD